MKGRGRVCQGSACLAFGLKPHSSSRTCMPCPEHRGLSYCRRRGVFGDINQTAFGKHIVPILRVHAAWCQSADRGRVSIHDKPRGLGTRRISMWLRRSPIEPSMPFRDVLSPAYFWRRQLAPGGRCILANPSLVARSFC